jgi:hypothetical protein
MGGTSENQILRGGGGGGHNGGIGFEFEYIDEFKFIFEMALENESGGLGDMFWCKKPHAKNLVSVFL